MAFLKLQKGHILAVTIYPLRKPTPKHPEASWSQFQVAR